MTAFITYKALKEITDLAQFVRLFQDVLRFDDTGISIDDGGYNNETN